MDGAITRQVGIFSRALVSLGYGEFCFAVGDGKVFYLWGSGGTRRKLGRKKGGRCPGVWKPGSTSRTMVKCERESDESSV